MLTLPIAGSPMMPQNMPQQPQMGNGQMQQQHGSGSQQVGKYLCFLFTSATFQVMVAGLHLACGVQNYTKAPRA